MQEWTEIQIEIPVSYTDQASAIAQMAVPYGIYIEDYSDLLEEAPKIAHIDLIDEDLLQKDRTQAVIHLYISPDANPAEAVSFLRERLEAESIPHSLSTGGIKEEDWAFGWKKYYHPLRVGEHIVICPSWESCSLEPGDVMRMLDIGCGSGVLSIGAVLLGASQAVGVDIDATAVRVAAENAAMNRVEEKTRYLCGDLTDKVTGTYQVVCANIVADVIIRLAPQVGAFMDGNAVLLVSGIIDSRQEEVAQALEREGFSILESAEEKGWCAMAVRR